LIDNVPRETVNRWLKGDPDLPEEEALALQFGGQSGPSPPAPLSWVTESRHNMAVPSDSNWR